MAGSSFLEVADVIADVHLVVGVILNALLIYVIRRFSRFSLGTYKNLLLIFAAFDIFLSILHKVAKPGAIIVGTTFGCVTDTPFESRAITTFYCACFTVPFVLMNIHFLYRYWSIRRPELIARFSDKKFVALIAMFPVGEFVVWYLLVYYGLTGARDESGTITLRDGYEKKYGRLLSDGWIVMNYWEHGFNLRIFLAMIAFDVIMIILFTIAITLGSLTFYHIKKAEKVSAQAHSLQWKLFIAVCAQTFVPTLFVYIPYFCIINFPFFNLPLYFVDDAWMRMTACFPAWDAVIIILLIRDYRDGLFGMCRKKKQTAISEATWKTVSSIAPATIPRVSVYEREITQH